MRRLVVVGIAISMLASVSASSAPRDGDVRFATFNASSNRASAGLLVAD